MTISAVIFDLDGTVLDNEDEYGAAFGKVLRSLGKHVDKKYPHTQGIGVKENWPLLLSKYHIKTKRTVEELARATQDAYLQMLSEVTVKDGFEKFVKALKESGIQVALATSNAWWIVDEVKGELSLEGIFDIVTTGEEVTYNKPDPDIFILTAEKLGVERKDCLVIEDSRAGIEAAHRAGMKVVAISRDAEHARSLKEADLVIKGFRQLTSGALASL